MSLYLGIGMDVATVTLSNPCLTSPTYLKFVPYLGIICYVLFLALAQYKHLVALYLSSEETSYVYVWVASYSDK